MPSSLPITDPSSPASTPGVVRLPVLKALTSVRFFAALHVALYHLVRPFSTWGIFAGAIGVGYTGVAFFFFLSGFILTYAHASEYEAGRANYRKFWVARFARVYPVYLFAMILAGLVNHSDFRQKVHILAFIADLFLVQAWSVRMVNFFNSGAWTLSCEAFFYFSFPFLLLALRPSTLGRAFGWACGFYSLALAMPIYCLIRYPAASYTEVFGNQPGLGLVFRTSRLPIAAIPEFLAGVAVGWLFLKHRPSPRLGAILATSGAILLGCALMLGDRLPYLPLHNGLLIPIYAMLLVGLGTPNWLTRALSLPFLVLLGEASFALYLFHIVFNDFMERFHFGHGIGYALCSLAVIVPLSVAMHVGIERPCRRLILGWWATRHPSEMKIA